MRCQIRTHKYVSDEDKLAQLLEIDDPSKEIQLEDTVSSSPGKETLFTGNIKAELEEIEKILTAKNYNAEFIIIYSILMKFVLIIYEKGTRNKEVEQQNRDTLVKKKLSMRTTAENEKAHSPGHSLCSECGK